MTAPHDTDPLTCPLCGRACDPVIFKFHRRIEPHIADRLEAMHAGWARYDGACPSCVHEAVREMLKERSETSLQRELQLPYPVFSREDTRLLPTPLRLRANSNYAGRRVTIAFLDSGFYPHPDLTHPRDRILRYVDATGEAPVEQEYAKKPHVEKWHGTMTSCVGAGNGFMSEGLYQGIAHKTNVVLVKTGNTRSRRIHDRDILRALEWVVAHQARYSIRVVNISLGGDRGAAGSLTELDRLVEEAASLGMVVVAAAGNSGRAQVDSPATAPAAVTVGGYDDQNTLERKHWRLYHSDWGTGADGLPKPDVIAPAIWLAAPMLMTTETHNEGMLLWQLTQSSDSQFARTLETKIAQDYFKQSTLKLPVEEIRRKIRGRMIEQKFIHAHYQHVDGTSFAAPIVSSVAAQMLEANPSLTPAQVKTILTGTAECLAQESREPQGHGAVNAARAVAAALRAPHGALAGLPLSPDVNAWGITFTYHDEDARDVALVGSFNDWHPHGYALHQIKRGIWQITIPPLSRGEYAYKLLVNRADWTRDAENDAVIADGYGGYHSILKT